MVRNQIFRGFSLWPLLPDRTHLRSLIAEVTADLFAMVTAGVLLPVIGETYALEHAADAHRALASRHTVGKLLLHP